MAYKNESLINTIELGRAIKRRREELSMSLRDVADTTNVSASTLSRIENGTGKPDADNIARLTSWLDMPVDRVMKKQGTSANVEAVVYYPHEAMPVRSRQPSRCLTNSGSTFLRSSRSVVVKFKTLFAVSFSTTSSAAVKPSISLKFACVIILSPRVFAR